MGKISKKYIGPDQVGSVQIELENGLSLRSKTQDGLSTVDLLEYSASDALVVQQDLHVLATKNIISDTALGSAFNIQTSLGADIIVEPGAASGADNGGITYIRGGDSATGVAGAIFLQPGQDAGGAKSTVQVEAGSLVLQGSCPIQMFSASTQNLQIFESLDFADSYGIKANNYNLVMYTNNQTAAATNSSKVSVISGNSALGNTGVVEIFSGNADVGNSGQINIVSGTAAGNSGHLSLETGVATGNRGDINTASRDFNINVPDSGRVKIFSDYGAGTYFDFFFTGFGEASDAAGLLIQNAGSVLAFINQSFGQNNQAVGETIYSGGMIVSNTGGTYTAGKVTLESGSGSASFISATDIEVSSGDIEIVTRNAYIAGTGADASTGDILLRTGVELGAGTRGSITLDALEVQCSAMQFKDAANPTDAQDLATKAYVDQQISSGTTCDKQSITLSAGDISNQYVDLNEQFVPESLFVGVGQRVNLYETLDYTLSIVGGVTRLTFAGPSATGGAEALDIDDVLYIQGIVDISP